MAHTQRIYNGQIVCPDGVIEHGTVVIEDGRIRSVSHGMPDQIGPHDIDVDGAWVMPGMVDIHSDTIEREIGPRPNTMFPIDVSFYELERKLVSQGITTIYHALALTPFKQDGLRSLELTRQMIENIESSMNEERLIRHRVHLRYDICYPEAQTFVRDLLETRRIDELSIMDHTPGQGQYRDLIKHRERIMQNRMISEHEAEQVMQKRIATPKLELAAILNLTEVAYRQGIPIASHDDDTIDKLNLVSDWHVRISEFPVALDVAIEATRRGMFVVLGAPNVLRGESHSGNLSALDAIAADAVDILCSDYYPPSMLRSVFALRAKGYPMPKLVNMVSYHPARALGIDDEVGSIQEGKQADLIVVRDVNQFPVIETVLVGGVVACRMNYARPSIRVAQI